MLNKNELLDSLTEIFEKTETEKEMMEFNCILLGFASEICQAFGDEDDGDGEENDTDIS